MPSRRAGFWFILSVLTLMRLARADVQLEWARCALEQAERNVAVAASILQQRQQEVDVLVASQQSLLAMVQEAQGRSRAAQAQADGLEEQLNRLQDDLESLNHRIARQSFELDHAQSLRDRAWEHLRHLVEQPGWGLPDDRIIDAWSRWSVQQQQVERIEHELAQAVAQRASAEAMQFRLLQQRSDALREAQIAHESALANQVRADRLSDDLRHAQAAWGQASVALAHAMARRDSAALHYHRALEWSLRFSPEPFAPARPVDPERHRREVTPRERQAQRVEDERRPSDRRDSDPRERQAQQRDDHERQAQRQEQTRREEEDRRRETRERSSQHRDSDDRRSQERESRDSDSRRRDSDDRGERYRR